LSTTPLPASSAIATSPSGWASGLGGGGDDRDDAERDRGDLGALAQEERVRQPDAVRAEHARALLGEPQQRLDRGSSSMCAPRRPGGPARGAMS
jgi:hypothetical protein